MKINKYVDRFIPNVGNMYILAVVTLLAYYNIA